CSSGPTSAPRMIRNATRIAITIMPNSRYHLNARAHGASVRRAATTMPATARINASRSGLVVRLAAVASPIAQIHHAIGWSVRGAVVVDAPDVVVGASGRVVGGCFAVVGVDVGAAPSAAVVVGGGAIADGAVVAGGRACPVTGLLVRGGGFRGAVVVVVVVGT